MVNDIREAVVGALAAFVLAKSAIELTFDATSATEIVSAVLKGQKAREGRCVNGLEYFVHGIGYTVVTPSGGQVHYDSGDAGEGDVFSANDIRFFLETSQHMPVPAIDDIKRILNDLRSSGIVLQFRNRFGIQDPSFFVDPATEGFHFL
jgi:hypothetical protein